MTERALGPGAACCGDAEGCDLGCFNAEPTPADTAADAPELDLFDEEDGE